MKNMKYVLAIAAVVSFTSGVVFACAGNKTAKVGRDENTAYVKQSAVARTANYSSASQNAAK